ncbi:hypothetical protein P9112_000430 [Eukaryota sp. TZLM1-RC]
MELPPAISSLRPFTIRAAQFSETEPLMSYYIKMYVVEQAMKKSSQSGVKPFVVSLLDVLEKEKSTLPVSETDGLSHCTAVMLSLLKKAMDEESEGTASQSTAATYDVCRIIIESCGQFGELSSDLQQKRKFCLSRIREILKNPNPNPNPNPKPNTEEMDAVEQELEEELAREQEEMSTEGMKVKEKQEVENDPEEPKLTTEDQSNHDQSLAQTEVIEEEVDFESLQQAEKYIKWSLSSIQLDKVQETILHLEKALKMLKK